MKYQIPDLVRIRALGLEERACYYRPGEVCFYESSFEHGLRFPMDNHIRKLLVTMDLAPVQPCQEQNREGSDGMALRGCSNGSVTFADNCDPDRMTIHEIILIAHELRAPPTSSCWYRHPQNGFNNELVQLIKDRDILEMRKWVLAYKVIDMYLEHGEKEGVMADCVPLNIMYHDLEWSE
ncbi:hypothetical protein LguiB_032241 [Lonicera macranthoides]